MILAGFILIAFGVLSLAQIEITSSNRSFVLDAIATVLSVVLCFVGFGLFLMEVW